jgi:hypothetical protein
LTKEGAQYALAPDSALFLNRHSPAYIGTAIEFLLTPRLREAHARLTEAVRRGGSALGEGTLEPEKPDWVKFAQAVMPLMHMPAEIMVAELRKGGAFETDFGSGYDLALITNFLHHFDPPTCTTFMRKVHAALKPGGRAAIAELVPNPDRVTPPTAAAFSMMMLATTPSGDAYTFAELESISKSAGFARVELAPPEIGLDRLVIAYR